MKALLEISPPEGPKQEHWVEPGAVLGRRSGTLLLADPRVSSRHADIINEDGRLFVRDLKSTHGLWDPGKRVSRLPLTAGATFKMGDTTIKVVRVEQTEADRALGELLAALKSSKDPKSSAAPFPRLLKLEFLQGPHTGETWPLGYGPRTIGTRSLDLAILDPEAKEECFRLESRGEQVFLVSPHEHFVKVNDRYIKEAALQPNDLVAFGETLIRVTAG